ncbi:hypothetical protein H0H93_007010 [Arthromyces matolae]|nr:hypothetical protein H0H93_007010 [Arthromyces matolae]
MQSPPTFPLARRRHRPWTSISYKEFELRASDVKSAPTTTTTTEAVHGTITASPPPPPSLLMETGTLVKSQCAPIGWTWDSEGLGHVFLLLIDFGTAPKNHKRTFILIVIDGILSTLDDESPQTPQSICRLCSLPYFGHHNLSDDSTSPPASSQSATNSTTDSHSQRPASTSSAFGRSQRPSNSAISSYALLPSTQETLAPPSIAAFTRWNPPSSSVSTSANDARVSSYQRFQATPPNLGPSRSRGVTSNPALTSAFGSGRNRQVHSRNQTTHRPVGRASGRAKSLNFCVIIHPEPINYESAPHRCPVKDKMTSFVTQAYELGLAFDLDLSAMPNDAIAPILDQKFITHINSKRLSFFRPPPLETSPYPSPSRHHHYKWNLLYTKMAPRAPNMGAILNTPLSALSSVTIHDVLMSSRRLPQYDPPPAATNRIPRYVIFICELSRILNLPSLKGDILDPVYEVIQGPLSGNDDDNVHHLCLAPRLWDRHETSALRESSNNPQCHEECFRDLHLNDLSSPPTILPEEPSHGATFFDLTVMSPPPVPDHLPGTSSDVAALTEPPTNSLPISVTPSPIAATTSSNENAHAIEYLVYAEERINHFVPLLTSEEFRLEAPTEEKAGEALFNIIHACANNLPLSVAADVVVSNATTDALLGNMYFIKINNGFGNGPESSAWAKMIKYVTKNALHWRSLSNDFYCPRLQDISWSNDDLARFKTYGFIIALSYLRLHPSFPITPHLFPFLLHGFETAVHDTLIHQVSPNTFLQLQTWPPADPSNIDLSSDPVSMLVHYLELEPALIPNMVQSRANIDNINHQLRSAVIFGTPRYHDIQSFPAMIAVQKGFDLVFHPSCSLRRQVFADQSSVIAITGYMFQCSLINSPEDVIKKIAINNVIEDNSMPNKAHLEHLFLRSVARFLQGSGAPHETDTHTGPAAKTHRCRRFVNAVTGAEQMTPNVGFCFEFYSPSSSSMTTECKIQVCNRLIQITLFDDVCQLLSEDMVSQPVDDTTPFDEWFYCILDEDYNRA